jgi:phosphatidylglycerophosphate synthase
VDPARSAAAFAPVKLWIDGAAADRAVQVFGMGLVERHLRAARKSRLPLQEVIVDGGDPLLPETADVRQALPVVSTHTTGSLGTRLRRALEAGGGPLLALAGDSLVDPRLLSLLAQRAGGWIARAPEPSDGAVLLRLEPQHRDLVPADAASLAAVADAMAADGAGRVLQPEDFPGFIVNLRRTVPFYLFTLRDAAAVRRCERFLFGANYKGSTDVLTKYVYPPLVWLITRLLTRWRVHPNWVTLLSILLAFGAVPFFAVGQFAIGLAMAYAMSVLDSVDGKVARLTFADSKLGNVLDHGLDIVHPPLWYAAWAAGLTTKATLTELWTAAWICIACYVADRLVLAIYPWRFKRGLHTHAPLDAWLRTFIARRNTNLIIITAGLIVGEGIAAFYAVTAWQALTLAYHAGRTAWIFGVQRAAPLPAP